MSVLPSLAGIEVMIMYKAFECAFDHDVLKVCWPCVLRDERSVRESEAEVTRTKRNRLVWTDDAARGARDGLFVSFRRTGFVEVDVER
jgi:hypothetical protein